MPRTPKLVFATLTFAVLCLASAGVAHADPVVNGSFENPNIPDGSFVYNPTGASFTFTASSGIIDAPGGAFLGQPAPDGEQYAFLQTGSTSGLASSFSQTITLTSAGQYTLSFFDAGRPSPNPNIGGNLAYQVFLDSTVIAAGATTTGQPFTLRSFNFNANAGSFTLSFSTPFQPGVDNSTFFDVISITLNQPPPPSAVPEPATMLLLGTGLAGVAAKVRKRRKSRDSADA